MVEPAQNGHHTAHAPPTGSMADQYLFAIHSTMAERVMEYGRYGLQFRGRRDLVKTFGYLDAVTFQDFWSYSLRGLGSRIVELFPRATWALSPTIRETEEPGDNTPFEQDVAALTTRLDLWGVFKDLDVLAQIGEYGVLLMGVEGVGNYSAPLSQQTFPRGPDSLLYLRPYRQDRADIHSYDMERTSARYGLPEQYRLETRLFSSGGSQLTDTFEAHHSHCLHFADNTRENRVLGQPILLKVIDQLFDLYKMTGGIAEMTYRDGKRRVVTELREGYDTITKASKEAVEAFAHDFQDTLAVTGTDVKSINGDVPNIGDNVRRLYELIAGILDAPMRIIFGSEQGQLATEQDARKWNQQRLSRFEGVAVPRIIRPFIDWCLENGILRPPAEEYEVIAPDFLALSTTEQAEVDNRNTTSLRAYVGPLGDPETIVTREEFRTLGLSTWNLAPKPAGGFPEEDPDDEPDVTPEDNMDG